MIVVLMGVTGSGKSTIGTLLAERTGAVFADADDYHPLANKEKMAAGHPLNDDDRQPWLYMAICLASVLSAAGSASVSFCGRTYLYSQRPSQGGAGRASGALA